MANPLFNLLGGRQQPQQMPSVNPAEYKQRIDQASAQMQQQGRDPSREWQQLKASGRLNDQQIRIVEQLSQNVARRLYGR